jgi:hypothetical protein
MTTLAQATEKISKARIVGRVVRGALIGMLLVPAFCGLISLVGGISAFAYQGY